MLTMRSPTTRVPEIRMVTPMFKQLRTTTERGYGWSHRKLRATLLPQAWGSPCWRCGQLMLPGQDIELGHDDWDRSIYRGMEHYTCNRKAGVAKLNTLRRMRKQQRLRPLARTIRPMHVALDINQL